MTLEYHLFIEIARNCITSYNLRQNRFFALKRFRKEVTVFALPMRNRVNTLICVFKIVSYIIPKRAYIFNKKNHWNNM